MRRLVMATMLALPLSVFSSEDAEQTAKETPEDEQLVDAADPKPCPTRHEVRSYLWIEPKTGREYRMLNIYCPGEDEA